MTEQKGTDKDRTMGEKQDFSDIGDRIRSAIQDAVESGDFGQINDIVYDTVGGAMDEVRRQVNQAHDRINRSYGDRSADGQDRGTGAEEKNADKTDYGARYRGGSARFPRRTMYASQRAAQRQRAEAEATDADYREVQADEDAAQGGGNAGTRGARTYGGSAGRRGSGQGIQSLDAQKMLPARYINNNGKVAGILYTVFGGIGLGFFGFTTLGFLITLIVTQSGEAAGLTLLFGLLTGGSAIMLGKGCGLRGRLKRAERYMKLAKDKMYLELETLSSRTGQSLRRVRRDVRGMLNAGIFPEGHLDEQEKVLVLTDETWRQYEAAQQEYENRQRLEGQEKEQAQNGAEEGMDLTAEQQIEKEGRAYMERLRQLNVEIPGEVISNKLYQLDYLLQRIFMVLKEHPEKCPQMRKFMDYYLPTTVKLVEAYADFDKAGIQGDNIMTAKAEIEKTMDTINQAFEKLLDDMYQDAAFEAAADAKVLKTVLAQDGYMKSEFSVNHQKEGE